MNCLNCGCETANPKFCGRSCSAKFTNKLSPKRKRLEKSCACGSIVTGRRKVCEDCTRTRDMTLEEAIYSEGLKRSGYALVRARARALLKDQPQVCEVCGYDKYVEAAHVKGIASFPLSTMVSIINSRDNLKLLCPNHHWELDNL